MKTCNKCKRELSLDSFHSDKSKPDKLATCCKECKSDQQKDYHKRNRAKRNKSCNDRYYRQKEWYYKLKESLSCERCGEDHQACLHFHHKDPATKDFVISNHWNDFSKERVLKEIDKCVVLCANCHAKEHWVYDGNGGRIFS